ncbi:LON peptidase substrate-binding domain-containing protein [Hyphomonas sp. FCG-A18]|uniref:LON peptidase substrate-binding domain-containing protein n=1 Tax=Hyphomonas sp. FCG-A18 TaxID=3080019 RepID=UPI002B2CA707|nr:LON peptidase substrate-binding domain-containing protein [Hyphomonas sp. FCG-A18]
MAADPYRKLTDLPEIIPVFPLAGAMLFPRWSLPLNIFEPRYLNMIDDAMAGDRIIGMVQSLGGDPAAPALAKVGCAGRITSYAETEDGRYLISLTGICRFGSDDELDVNTPYRQVRAKWAPFESDLMAPKPGDLILPRSNLVNSLKRYSNIHQMEVDWEAVENAQLETLINALCAGCPFGVMEKQALLEAPSVIARAETLMALLDMDAPGNDTSTLQ